MPEFHIPKGKAGLTFPACVSGLAGRSVTAVSSLVLMFSLGACLDDGASLTELATFDDAVTASAAKKGTAVAGNGKVRSITLTPDEVSLVVGETDAVQATAVDNKGRSVAVTFTWSSSDSDVAVVEGGLVTGRSSGVTQVTARTGRRSATATVRVSDGSASDPPESPEDPQDPPEDPQDPPQDPPGDPPPPPSNGPGIWISSAEIAQLPTSGTAWSRLKGQADSNCGTPDLADQDDGTNVCVMAKALVYARIGGSGYLNDVTSALRSIAQSGRYSGRALALGRELIAYVIAADVIDLAAVDSSLDGAFRGKLRELLTTPTSGGPSSLVECHERRPNNWGTHCGGSRAAVAAYLGDTAELAEVADVFRGWVGDRAAYDGFSYGNLSWQCDSSRPVGINPQGCSRSGHSLDGVLPDDQRRGGDFSWPPPKENYVYEGLQGALATAVILHRSGYDAFSWGDQALLRAFRWLHDQANYTAAGDDTWEPHVVNHFYNTSFPAPTPSNPGKNVGWTDWTLR